MSQHPYKSHQPPPSSLRDSRPGSPVGRRLPQGVVCISTSFVGTPESSVLIRGLRASSLPWSVAKKRARPLAQAIMCQRTLLPRTWTEHDVASCIANPAGFSTCASPLFTCSFPLFRHNVEATKASFPSPTCWMPAHSPKPLPLLSLSFIFLMFKVSKLSFSPTSSSSLPSSRSQGAELHHHRCELCQRLGVPSGTADIAVISAQLLCQ